MTTLVEELPVEKTGVIHVMDRTGDTNIFWNKDDPQDVAIAKAAFDFARSREGGHKLAYRVEGKKGKRGEVMREFDPTAERVILAPQLVGG